jgi:hypothetical protein
MPLSVSSFLISAFRVPTPRHYAYNLHVTLQIINIHVIVKLVLEVNCFRRIRIFRCLCVPLTTRMREVTRTSESVNSKLWLQYETTARLSACRQSLTTLFSAFVKAVSRFIIICFKQSTFTIIICNSHHVNADMHFTAEKYSAMQLQGG